MNVLAVEEAERHQNNTSAKTRQLENEVLSLQQEGERLEREIMLKRKALEMLPSAADNIGKEGGGVRKGGGL
jgi:predicted RNase H-like nuclease (RuvC/YqgF family)